MYNTYMRAPFLLLSVALIAGVLIRLALRSSPVWLWFPMLSLLPLLWFSRGSRWFLPSLTVSMVMLGILYADLAAWRPANAIEHFAQGKWVSLEGVVKTAPEVKTGGKKVTVSFVLESKNLMQRVTERFRRHREIFETWGDVQVFLLNPGEIPFYGDRVRLWGELGRPKPVLNPGEFDYGRYLADRSIHAVLTGYGRKSVRPLHSGEGFWLLKKIEELRRAMSRRLDELFDARHAPLLKALVLGMRKDLDPALWDDFIKTGTAHLLAISGLNISLVAGSFYLAMILAGLGRKAAAFLSLFVIVFYVAIAGAGIPVQRAGWMAGLALTALLMDREVQSINTFCFALMIFLVSNTLVLNQISFQLSFLSVLSLIVLFRSFREGWRAPAQDGRPAEGLQWGVGLFASTAAVMVGTFPITIYYFNVFSWVSLFANAGVIPLFHAAVLSAFLALGIGWIPLVGGLFPWAASLLLDAGLAWIHFCGRLDWGFLYLATPTWIQLIFYYLLFALCLGMKFLRWPLPKLFAAALWSLWFAAALSFFWPPPPSPFTLTLFSAGRNEMAYVGLGRGNHWLINAGRLHPSDQARWMVAPFLREKGIKRLTGILFTDFYKKHTGGAGTLLRDFSVGYLLHPGSSKGRGPFFSTAVPRKVHSRPLTEGERIQMRGGGEIRVLGEMDHQLALMVSYEGRRFLFLPHLGDRLAGMLERYRRELFDIDVLVLPSPSRKDRIAMEMLFDSLDPLVVTTPHEDGKLGRFLKDRDIAWFNLSKSGALTFEITNALRMIPFREGRARVL